ncbi:DinB family protein [Salipaludibacillus agaradhaerens]|uniref:DinB family protein n=1 Tax=Salipaludibacillus agaradhaerens TaxID=76935 RepID=A0A9Q4B511_SALAG|nr:DinB family protein [Salipaludibacillus agaradhaerens]MCR6098095.1 DinB family protein [Salipaludibacillus agaradhaerens]MCR6116275.1 DinB family protein [Salipaludibacillus agaradhaerens]
MSSVLNVRDHLLDELQLAVKTSEKLIFRMDEADKRFRPADNMRTLLDVVHHLVSIPASDLMIMQEKSQEEVQSLELRIAEITEPARLVEEFRYNYEQFKSYIQSLSEEELLTKSTKAFYMEEGVVQIKWLIEVVTHVFHHRSQLYNYLKQNGHELNFFMLYG